MSLSIFTQLGRSIGFRSALLTTIGNLSSTAVAAVAMILFSRALGPADFGIFSVLFSLMLILSRLGDLGLNIALTRLVPRVVRSPKRTLAYSQSAVFLKLALSLIFATLGLILSPSLAHWLNLSDSTIPLLRWVFVGSFTIVVYEHVNAVMQSLHHFSTAIFANLTQSTLKFIFAITVFFGNTFSLATAIFLYLLAPLAGVIAALRTHSLQLIRPRLHAIESRQLIKIARWTSISVLAGTLAENIDILLVQSYLNPYETGLYSAASRIAMLISLVGWSLGSVLNVRVASYHTKENMDRYLRKAYLISLGSFGLTLALMLLSPLLITYTVGVEYTLALAPLNLLLISTALTTANTPFIALFYSFDHPRYFAISGILTATTLILTDLWLIPQLGLLGAAWARILTRLLIILYTLFTARSLYQKRYAQA